MAPKDLENMCFILRLEVVQIADPDNFKSKHLFTILPISLDSSSIVSQIFIISTTIIGFNIKTLIHRLVCGKLQKELD